MQKRPYKDIEDRFELAITESGEYNIYVISATSDYLALKHGLIEVSKWEQDLITIFNSFDEDMLIQLVESVKEKQWTKQLDKSS